MEPDITGVKRRVRAADQGFKACIAGAPGTPPAVPRAGGDDAPGRAPTRAFARRRSARSAVLQAATAKQIAHGYLGESAPATFKVIVNPLVSWMWIGGLIALLGALIALWPQPLAAALRRTRRPRRSKEAKYREIRDAELDHAAGKLSDEDFALLDAELRNEAVEILDRLEERRGEEAPVPSPAARLDLQQDEGVDGEEDREEDRRPVEVSLDHRATAEGAAAAADPERSREPGVFARVQQDQEDQDEGDQDLEDAEDRVHGGILAPPAPPAAGSPGVDPCG